MPRSVCFNLQGFLFPRADSVLLMASSLSVFQGCSSTFESSYCQPPVFGDLFSSLPNMDSMVQTFSHSLVHSIKAYENTSCSNVSSVDIFHASIPLCHFTNLGIAGLSNVCNWIFGPCNVMIGFCCSINSFLLCSSITLIDQLSISSGSALRLQGAAVGNNHLVRLMLKSAFGGPQALLRDLAWSLVCFSVPCFKFIPFRPQIPSSLEGGISYFTETIEAIRWQ